MVIATMIVKTQIEKNTFKADTSAFSLKFLVVVFIVFPLYVKDWQPPNPELDYTNHQLT